MTRCVFALLATLAAPLASPAAPRPREAAPRPPSAEARPEKAFHVRSDEPAYAARLSVNAEQDTHLLRYTYSSLTTPVSSSTGSA